MRHLHVLSCYYLIAHSDPKSIISFQNSKFRHFKGANLKKDYFAEQNQIKNVKGKLTAEKTWSCLL